MNMWWKNLLSSSTEVSEKRLISLLSFLVLIVMVGLSCYGIIIPSNLIYVFTGLCSGSSVATLFEKGDNKDVN